MKHLDLGNSSFHTAILIKESALQTDSIIREYCEPLKRLGYDTEGLIAISLEYDRKKVSAACRKSYLEILLPVLESIGIKQLIVCDSEYFKGMAKVKKVSGSHGYIYEYEGMDMVLGFNHQQFFYNPDVRDDLLLSFNALISHVEGTYEELGGNVLHEQHYPETVAEIGIWLEKLHRYPALTCDIEAFSLKHYDSGIGTIAFAWDEHSGVAFNVDYSPLDSPVNVLNKAGHKTAKWFYGEAKKNEIIRRKLRRFFETYKGKLIYHNISYDGYVLVYQLWMDNLLDQQGLLNGLEHVTRNFHCTKLITYLSTNSCSGNHLSLKHQSHEFTGNYAEEDIKDIRLIAPEQLLRYNLIDTCATWFVMNKHYPSMVEQQQLDIYDSLFIPAVKDIIQMQLTGMCLDMDKVMEAEVELCRIRSDAMALIHSKYITKLFIDNKKKQELYERNEEYKTKVIGIDDVKFKFNPNSNPQMQQFLYEYLQLPVIDTTKTKQPACGGDTLEKLLNHTDSPDYKDILNALIDFALVDKIIGTFIKAFKEAPRASDGCHYLYGAFNLGGTVSGRLSSSNPNMQNIPSGSKYAKLIKACFIAPQGWLFCGADSASLEDRIDTLLTKDPNKLKVYTDGYDGHSLRAYNYFPHAFEGIPETPEGINGTKKTHAQWRQDSKAPTFALTYQGTWMTLMNQCGFDEMTARSIEANYHRMYAVSDEWKKDKIAQASKDGYATVAFGLRVRTPLLNQVILGNCKTPYEAEAEGRTVGNAMGQSYGLMNSRSSVEVMNHVRASKYALDILPCAQIHDAIYYRVRGDFETLEFLNKIVGDAMSWQELPEIAHDEVKLSGELDIFYPSWRDDFTIPNDATALEIKELCLVEVNKRNEEGM